MSGNFEKLNIHLKKAAAFTSVLNLIDYDGQVNAPAESDENMSKVTGIIAGEYHDIFTKKEFTHLLDKCVKDAKKGKLTAVERCIVKEAVRKNRELMPIPADEYKEFSELTARSVNVWAQARKNKSFDEFAPELEKIVNIKKKFASYIKKNSKEKYKGRSEYDVLLSSFERDFMSEELDDIFEQVKTAVIPLVKNVKETDCSFLKLENEDIPALREFCSYIADYIGFNNRRGTIGESEHPFTINMHNHDVRITNSFNADNILEPIFSIIHEGGHALYEQGISDTLTLTVLGEGTSMGMHEGQSRFYENMIGRNVCFWKPLFARLTDTFSDKLKDVSFEKFMDAVNAVTPGPIRIAADELTYPLHIIIRYELEKLLFSGKIDVKDLPSEWNKRYEKYLGIKPENDAQGVLQDIHWSMGEFGYFPSYLIGSAVSAQIYSHLADIMPVEKYMKDGNLSDITSYLRENIYRYGKMYGTNQLLKKMMGEEFNIRYYIDYLTKKWG